MKAESAVVEKPGTEVSTTVRSFRFINSTKIWGGEERFVFDLATGLKALGHPVSVSGRPGTEFLSRIAAAGLETFPVYPKFDYDWRPLGKFSASSNEEVFVAVTPKDFKLLRMLAFFRPKAQFFWHLGVAYPEPTWEYRWLFKNGNLRLITPSNYLKSRVLADFPQLENRISVLPNGADIPSIGAGPARQALVERHGVSPNKLFLGIFSRIVGWKGHSLLFKALRISQKEGVDFHLWVVGGGEKERFEKEAKDLGVDDRVTFIGHQKDVGTFMAGVDIVCLPSENEPFGYVVLEGMALGKAVLASASGGPLEILADGKDGLLLSPKEPEAWAGAIGDLSKNEKRRLELGQAARRSVREKFSLPRMISGFLEIVDAHSAIGRA